MVVIVGFIMFNQETPKQTETTKVERNVEVIPGLNQEKVEEVKEEKIEVTPGLNQEKINQLGQENSQKMDFDNYKLEFEYKKLQLDYQEVMEEKNELTHENFELKEKIEELEAKLEKYNKNSENLSQEAFKLHLGNLILERCEKTPVESEANKCKDLYYKFVNDEN